MWAKDAKQVQAMITSLCLIFFNYQLIIFWTKLKKQKKIFNTIFDEGQDPQHTWKLQIATTSIFGKNKELLLTS
jgi:hypothetical protein